MLRLILAVPDTVRLSQKAQAWSVQMRTLFGPLRSRDRTRLTLAIRTTFTGASLQGVTPPGLWAHVHGLNAPSDPLDGAARADVAIVGLGLTGLSAAVELASRGAHVVGIDAGPIAHGASIRSLGVLAAGMALPYHDVVATAGRERAAEIYRATLDELAARHDDDVTRWPGSLRIASSDAELADCQRQRDAMRADGLPVADYDGVHGVGLELPTTGVTSPAAELTGLIDRATGAGVEMFAHTAAQQTGDRDRVTWSGEIRCQRVIIAVDGGLEQIVPALVGEVRTARIQAAAMHSGAPTGDQPVVTRWGHDRWRPDVDGRLVASGRRDRGGASEWTADAAPTDVVQAEIDDLVAAAISADAVPGEVSGHVTHRWAGTSSFTEDGLPRLIRMGSTIAVGAYNGFGNVLGPMLGRLAADIALGDRPKLAKLFVG